MKKRENVTRTFPLRCAYRYFTRRCNGTRGNDNFIKTECAIKINISANMYINQGMFRGYEKNYKR